MWEPDQEVSVTVASRTPNNVDFYLKLTTLIEDTFARQVGGRENYPQPRITDCWLFTTFRTLKAKTDFYIQIVS